MRFRRKSKIWRWLKEGAAVAVVVLVVVLVNCGGLQWLTEPDYANDPVAREELVLDLIQEFGWPYSVWEVDGTARAICAWLDSEPLPRSSSAWAVDGAREYLRQVIAQPIPGSSQARDLYTQSVIDSVAFLQEWSAGLTPGNDPRGGAVIVADVLVVADMWCPHHAEQLDLFG